MRNAEQHEILGAFADLLAVPTGDGGVKRAEGSKPFWKVDTSHPAASGRHRAKYAEGERYDVESGAHHLVHSAWRDLATAYQEMVDDGLIPESPRDHRTNSPLVPELMPWWVVAADGSGDLVACEVGPDRPRYCVEGHIASAMGDD